MSDDPTELPSRADNPDGSARTPDPHAGDPSPSRPTPRRPRDRGGRLHAWTTTAVAVIALALSVISLAQNMVPPGIDMVMPNQIRLVQGPGTTDSLVVYVQPSMSIARKSDRTAVLTSFALTLHKADATQPDPVIYWNEFGQFTSIPDTGMFNYQRIGDPQPLVVTQDKPQSPLLTLRADQYLMTPGLWNGELVAIEPNGDRLVQPFCLNLTPRAAEWLRRKDGDQWRAFRNDLAPAGNRTDSCYEPGPVSDDIP